MADIRVMAFRRTFFITDDVFSNKEKTSKLAWTPGPGFEDVVRNFHRNHLVINYVTANFKQGPTSVHDEHDDVSDFLEAVKNSCDENATGFWTWHQFYYRNRRVDVNTNTLNMLDTGDGKINLFFENEADLEAVLKNCNAVKDLM